LTGKNRYRIGVFGASECDDRISSIAEETGRILAKNNSIVYCGGRGGVMESVSKGVNEYGGIVVGILPTTNISDANKYITIPILSGMGEGRNNLIANSIDGAIAISGSYGTLSEISHTLSQKKPVVTIHSWDIMGCIKAITPEAAVRRIYQECEKNNIIH
tara:strand:- start:491 stop:970 length:480 start_codon:yes stop_codon:yes gene_type:complete